METNLLREIAERVDSGEYVAVATITGSLGSIPGKVGAMLLVFQDGTIKGTIGGGKVEYEVIQRSKEALLTGKNFEFDYNMSEKEGLACGGSLKGFVKIYAPQKKLVIFGGGHVGRKIAKLAENFGFDVYVIDNRAEYKDLEDFNNIKKYISLEIEDGIKSLNFDKDTYVVATTRSHKLDEEVVSNLLDFEIAYLGMLGSRRKVELVKKMLKEKGFSDDKINSIHTPIGLKIDNGSPEEIALSIISEIVMIKNKLSCNI